MPTIAEIMQAMPAALVPEKAADVNTVVQFDFTGEGGGQYVMRIHDGTCEIKEGSAPDANMTMIVAASDYVDVVEGRLDGVKAFMSGKIKAKGDIMFMMKMQKMFDPKRVQS